jgi:hypothetical protein
MAIREELERVKMASFKWAIQRQGAATFSGSGCRARPEKRAPQKRCEEPDPVGGPQGTPSYLQTQSNADYHEMASPTLIPRDREWEWRNAAQRWNACRVRDGVLGSRAAKKFRPIFRPAQKRLLN